jgi:hypothetical protein
LILLANGPELPELADFSRPILTQEYGFDEFASRYSCARGTPPRMKIAGLFSADYLC